jgi:hypothetical protein
MHARPRGCWVWRAHFRTPPPGASQGVRFDHAQKIMSVLSAPDARGTGAGDETPRAVFITDFVHMAVPFSELAPVLMDEGAAWLRRLDEPSASGPSADGSEQSKPTRPGIVAVTLRVGPGSRHARQAVRVTSGPPRAHGSHVILPITWEPLVFERVLPRLEADLELSDAGESFTRLSLSGRYNVPFAQLGLTIDRLAMHRLAEASLRGFLGEVEAAVIAER